MSKFEEIRADIKALQMRLHHSHSINDNVAKCDYKSCREEAERVAKVLSLIDSLDFGQG